LCSEIIELSRAEIQKLRLANWELGRAHSQLMAVCSFASAPPIFIKKAWDVQFLVEVFTSKHLAYRLVS
jgi:hypothetical protein